MFLYQKKLEYPVNIQKKDLSMAKSLNAAYGGPDGELGAALRYFNQKFSMPDEKGETLLSDIGCEELAHVEIIQTMISQLIKDASIEELKKNDLLGFYSLHNHGIFPMAPNGTPFSSCTIETTGDVIADLESDMAAEQRARAMYEHLINQTNDSDVIAPLTFLRQREVVHFNRFKELKEYYQDKNLK